MGGHKISMNCIVTWQHALRPDYIRLFLLYRTRFYVVAKQLIFQKNYLPREYDISDTAYVWDSIKIQLAYKGYS